MVKSLVKMYQSFGPNYKDNYKGQGQGQGYSGSNPSGKAGAASGKDKDSGGEGYDVTPFLNATDKDEMTPLMRAAMEGHFDVVEYFLHQCRNAQGLPNVKVAARDAHGCTALVLAADHMTAVDGDEESSKPDQMRAKVISLLVDHDEMYGEKPRDKANKLVDIADNSGRTALIVAAGNGLEDVVRCLIAGGANVNLSKKDGSTAIKKAAVWRHQAVVEVLINYGAKISSAELHEYR